MRSWHLREAAGAVAVELAPWSHVQEDSNSRRMTEKTKLCRGDSEQRNAKTKITWLQLQQATAEAKAFFIGRGLVLGLRAA